MSKATGYLHPGYVDSLAEFGSPRLLPHSGSWVLERSIPDFSYHDATWCYPLFTCLDWSQLPLDIEDLSRDLVSLAVVTDPFGNFDVALLQRCFRDVMIPFKDHFIIDLHRPLQTYISDHHRRNARSALERVSVEWIQNPLEMIDDWVRLYSELIARHQIQGIAAFSRTAFFKQFQIPGLIVLRAVHEGETIGMILWYIQGDVAYYHLGTWNVLGYKLKTSFALFWRSIEYFEAIGLRWLCIGAAPGVNAEEANGLNRFKRGWATGTRKVYFCGRIFDQNRYREMVRAKGVTDDIYFPAYRAGEFR